MDSPEINTDEDQVDSFDKNYTNEANRRNHNQSHVLSSSDHLESFDKPPTQIEADLSQESESPSCRSPNSPPSNVNEAHDIDDRSYSIRSPGAENYFPDCPQSHNTQPESPQSPDNEPMTPDNDPNSTYDPEFTFPGPTSPRLSENDWHNSTRTPSPRQQESNQSLNSSIKPQSPITAPKSHQFSESELRSPGEHQSPITTPMSPQFPQSPDEDRSPSADLGIDQDSEAEANYDGLDRSSPNEPHLPVDRLVSPNSILEEPTSPFTPHSPAAGPVSPNSPIAGPQSPEAGPVSSNSPIAGPQSPEAGPVSPNSPIMGPQSPNVGPVSPNSSIGGPQSPNVGPVSPMDGPQSPEAGPVSPMDGPQSPEAGQGSPMDGPQSPEAGPVSPMDGPQSPEAGPVSPMDGRQSPEARPVSHMDGPQSPEAGPISPMDGPQSPEAGPVSPMDGSQSPEAGPVSPQSTMDPLVSPDALQSPQDDITSQHSPRADSPSTGRPKSPIRGSISPQSPAEYSAQYKSQHSRRKPDLKVENIVSDGDLSDREDDEDVNEREKVDDAKGSDHEPDSDKESACGELIADIFGSSDDEEEFEGFGEADVSAAKLDDRPDETLSGTEGPLVTEDYEGRRSRGDVSDDNDDDLLISDKSSMQDYVSDFDIMMAKKKEESQKRRRRRRDEEMLTANDDLIDEMIKAMKTASEKDRLLNENRRAAVNKLLYLPQIMSQLKKADLHSSFIDAGVLHSITEWLAPLPDRSLPHLKIREFFLKTLLEFPSIEPGALKSSGIGKAVMYLYKHPKETKENRDMAGKLINEWSRPIFSLTSNFKLLSKEEREQRDYDQLPKRRRISAEGMETPRRDIDNALSGEERALRPGDPGWIMRARVPKPSNKDYVVRPKWNLNEVNQKPVSRKTVDKYEKHRRAMLEKKKKNRSINSMSIEGRNMSF